MSLMMTMITKSRKKTRKDGMSLGSAEHPMYCCTGNIITDHDTFITVVFTNATLYARHNLALSTCGEIRGKNDYTVKGIVVMFDFIHIIQIMHATFTVHRLYLSFVVWTSETFSLSLTL